MYLPQYEQEKHEGVRAAYMPLYLVAVNVQDKVKIGNVDMHVKLRVLA